jgi:transposase
MATTPPPLDFDHQPGFEIPTKHKETIRQLHGFAGKLVEELIARYQLGKSTINRILSYERPERARPSQTGRPRQLINARVNKIIK